MRLIRNLFSILLTYALAVFPFATPGFAGQSDVDLFAGGNRLPPNIMIMLDSSGSMRNPPSSGGAVYKKDIAKAALVNLIKGVNPPDGSGGFTENALFGLMTLRDDGASLQQQIATGNTSAVITAVNNHATSSVGTPLNGAILDVGRYFAANENWGTLASWGTRSGEGSVQNVWDYDCRDSFSIFISDGDPSGDKIAVSGYWATIGDSDGDAGAGQNGAETAMTVGTNNVEWTDDITKAMFDRDFSTTLEGRQNVITHVIGFDTNGANLQRMATAGGGEYRTTTSATGLSTALKDLTDASFDSLASYSTAVVPTSRTAFGSSFYNAFFSPLADDPFWEGHIEAFDLSPSGVILDASGSPAVDPLTDEFYEPHNPHWDAGERLRTNSSRDIYTTLSGQREDFTTNAFVKAALGITAADVGAFPNAASSGVNTTALAETALINYLHGQDAFDEDNDADFTELRDKVLGDIFHSTPVIVGPPTTLLRGEAGYDGYLTAWASRQRLLYSGANDGMYHAFDAGSLTSGDNPLTAAVETNAVFYTPGTGDEVFGYVPGLLLDDVKFVPRNYPRAYYFVDGSPVVADVWLRSNASDYTRETDEWSTVSIIGFREGGEGYLALDVTDPTSTSSTDAHGPYPKFLWEFTDSTLGDAWSDPVITRVKVAEGSVGDVCGHDNGDGNCRERWVAIFGGGYAVTADPNHDDFTSNPGDATWTDRSKAIYMVDLATGAVLDKIQFDVSANPRMIYSLPSEPAVIDKDFDGFADVVYIGDLGGQVWKWDISAIGDDSSGSDGIIDNWPHGIFFTAAVENVSGDDRYKSIYYPPSATLIRNTLWLTFATGEREQLAYSGAAGSDENNRVYVAKDYYPTGGSAFASSFVEGDLTDITSSSYDNNPSDQGYYFVAQDGEKFVSEIVTFAGYVILVSFEINVANPDPCDAANGFSRLYAFEVDGGGGYFTAGAFTPMEERYEDVGGGMASTPRISMAPDPNDDKMYIKTSKGRVLTIEPPPRDGSGSSMIYWKQNQ
jgi:type IV pilus assembly protein PilY1